MFLFVRQYHTNQSKISATLNRLSRFYQFLFVEFNWLCILAPLGPLECSPGSSLSAVQAPLGRPPHSNLPALPLLQSETVSLGPRPIRVQSWCVARGGPVGRVASQRTGTN